MNNTSTEAEKTINLKAKNLRHPVRPEIENNRIDVF